MSKSIAQYTVDASLLLGDHDLFNLVSGTDVVYDVNSFEHLAKDGVVPVQMLGRLATVANEKLRTSRIPTSVRHGKHTTIVVLTVSVQLAFDGVSGAATTVAVGATTLNDKVRDDTVEDQTIIETVIGQFLEVANRSRCIIIKKDCFHQTFCSMDFCYLHSYCVYSRVQR